MSILIPAYDQFHVVYFWVYGLTFGYKPKAMSDSKKGSCLAITLGFLALSNEEDKVWKAGFKN